jgi:O-antigen/teichoic acid export membrane protein
MEERAVRGVVWTFLSYGGSRAVTLLTTLVLARLLVPADFGLVSMATLVVGFFALFRDLGLGATLVARPDLDGPAVGTLFSLSMAISAAIAGIIAATAPLAAAFFGEPRLAAVLAVLALTVVISSVGAFYDCLLQRELLFRIRFYGQVVPVLAYAVTAPLLAVLGAGAWSLVVGQVVQAVVYTVLLVVRTPLRVRPTFDRAHAAGVLSASRGFLLQTAVAFVHLNSGTFAVGRILGPTAVGYYAMANRMAELPNLVVAEPVSNVTFPGFAWMRHRGDNVGPAFVGVLGLVALATAPLGVLLSAAADPFARVVLGPQWVPAIPLLTLLGLWAVVRPLQSVVGWFVNSMGLPALLGRASLCIVVVQVPAMMIAALLGGLVGVAIVILVDVLVTQIVLTVITARRCGVPAAAQWRAVRTVLLAAVLCWGVARLVVVVLGHAAPVVALTASCLAGAAAYLLVVLVVEPALLRSARTQLTRTLRARTPA